MSRTVKEWIGKSDDTPVPPRVKLRVFKRFGGICQECALPINPTRGWICDHRTALINGGANRESNLGPIHTHCDKTKTAADVGEKSRVYQKALAHHGVKARRGRPMPGSKASGIKKPFFGPPIDRRTGKPLGGARS